MMRSLFFFAIIFCGTLIFEFSEGQQLRATVEGNFLEVTTPYGSKLFFGDAGFGDLRHFQVEIPLDELKTNQIVPSSWPSITGNGMMGNDGGNGSSRNGQELLDTEDTLVLRASELYFGGKFKQSLTHVDELLRRNPSNIRALTMKGSLMHVMGEKDLARKSWEQALKLNPNDGNLKKLIGGGR